MVGNTIKRFGGVVGTFAVAGLIAWACGCSSAEQPASSWNNRALGGYAPGYISPGESGPTPSSPWYSAPSVGDEGLVVPQFGPTPEQVEQERQQWEREKAEMDLPTYSDPYFQDSGS